MIIKELGIKGVYEIQLESITDNRGDFTRIFDSQIFCGNNLPTNWVQENQSYTLHSNTIRGLHFQLPPFSETKLVRVDSGRIYDVFVDLRSDSKTFGKWRGITLSSFNNKMIIIPKGFAHGYITLTDNCNVLYKVDNCYNPHTESGIKWDDTDLNISFPIDWENKIIISDKDLKLPSLKDFISKYGSIKV